MNILNCLTYFGYDIDKLISNQLEESENEKKAITWYKSLTINQKILVKEITILLTGMEWKDFIIIFSPRERLNIVYNKLKKEDLLYLFLQ